MGAARKGRADGAVTDEQRPVEEEYHPKGTVAILILFVLAIVILWGSVYVILLSRGVTV